MTRSIRRLKGITTQTLLAMTVLTAAKGRNEFLGHKETWYNLPMDRIVQRAQEKGYQAQYWEREDGVRMYGHFVIVAADFNTHPYGSIVDTSLGQGIVLDTGDFAKSNPTTIDIAVNW